ncbi:salicylic acid-binding protein 2 isoform X2 [Helianthus annuus]|uniref:salicylic acid-binding protein 2 isoform X2 n=1 Tax=Helianthus annuus TaxID=4232 RepID=UPI000B8F3B44|nr:salicylic acid-binding protein 2 isoform X2 [Helianthus annuus]
MVHTTNQQTHFILVHGACHGSWCWFKLKPLLEAAGHHVSAFDLTASGTNLQVIQQVATLADYTMPLLDFIATLPLDEKVVLVGHSLGGMNIALAMEKFPQKVSVGVFLTAFMPDTDHKPSYVLDQDLELGKTLIRPSSLFMKDLRNAETFTKGGFGSVRRAYVICDEDKGIKKEFQQWMIDNNPVDEVKELKHVDHMPMLCDPKQLSVCLLDIAVQYA